MRQGALVARVSCGFRLNSKPAMKHASLMLHATVVVFGFTGILGKLIELPALPLVFWRCLIGAGALSAWLLARGKLRVIQGPDRWRIGATGVLVALHWAAFFHAIKVSNVAVALATLSTAPFFVALIAPAMNGRRPDWREMMLGLVAIGALAVIFDVTPGSGLGIFWSLIASALAATFSVLNARWVGRHDALNISRLELGVAVLSIGLFAWIQGAMQWPSGADWVWLGFLGVVATAAAFAVSVQVMKVISPFSVAIAINMEPVYAILLALAIFGESEQMNGGFYAGAAVLVGTVMVDAMIKRRRRPRLQR
jgi:drug/metabolite transporter (DMT)-like permease